MMFGLAFALFVARPSVVQADDIAVPISLQAQLLAKSATYDRNFATRAGDLVRILVVSKAGSAESDRTSSNLVSELRSLSSIAGKPVQVSTRRFGSAGDLKAAVRSQQISVVYLAAGLDADARSIASELQSVDVLTVSATPLDVEKGIVLGFDLVSGKPKILVNLPQSRRQNVDFKAEILKIAKVFS